MTAHTYRFLVRLAAPLALGYTLWRAGRDGGSRYLRQRRGRSLPEGPFALWVHCASVGEVRAAAPLVRALAEDMPGRSLLVTTNTPTGAQAAARDLPEGVEHAYLPLDLPGAVRRFLDRVRPGCAAVVETELWPNLFAACRRRGVPVVIVNGRLSPRTTEAPAWLRAAYAGALGAVTACLARSGEDAERFRALGLAEDAVRVPGNLKFAQAAGIRTDLPPEPPIDRPYVLAGSTRSGEERLLAEAWDRVGDAERVLVIAPRHPERRERILAELGEVASGIAVRSRGDPVTGATRIYLADTLGELVWLMDHADLVFLGGSLVPRGGHNVLEPAALGKAIVVGPHMDNFRDEADGLEAAGGLVRAAGADDLAARLPDLLADPGRRNALGRAALAFVRDQEGVLARYRGELRRLCPTISAAVSSE